MRHFVYLIMVLLLLHPLTANADQTCYDDGSGIIRCYGNNTPSQPKSEYYYNPGGAIMKDSLEIQRSTIENRQRQLELQMMEEQMRPILEEREKREKEDKERRKAEKMEAKTRKAQRKKLERELPKKELDTYREVYIIELPSGCEPYSEQLSSNNPGTSGSTLKCISSSGSETLIGKKVPAGCEPVNVNNFLMCRKSGGEILSLYEYYQSYSDELARKVSGFTQNTTGEDSSKTLDDELAELDSFFEKGHLTKEQHKKMKEDLIRKHLGLADE